MFGGTYFLGRAVEAVIVGDDGERAEAVVTGGQRIEFKKLVLPATMCPRVSKGRRNRVMSA